MHCLCVSVAGRGQVPTSAVDDMGEAAEPSKLKYHDERFNRQGQLGIPFQADGVTATIGIAATILGGAPKDALSTAAGTAAH